MAKQGMRKNDSSGATSGRNNPKQSMEITAGTPKKRETYEERARQGKDPDPVAQRSGPAESTRDHREEPTGSVHDRRGRRSGTESNKS